MSKCKVVFIISVLFVCATIPAHAATRSVPGYATAEADTGVTYHPWSTTRITLYVDDNRNVYFRRGGGTRATGYISDQEVSSVIELLRKGLQWSRKAAANNTERTEKLGTFYSDYKYYEQGIGLTFFSADNGDQTNVVFRIEAFGNAVEHVELYLKPYQVRQLIVLLHKVPETLKALREEP